MQDFRDRILSADGSKRARRECADHVLANPRTFPVLVSMAADVADRGHVRACSVLEIIADDRIGWLRPFLDLLVEKLPQWSHGSAVRAGAKMARRCLEAHVREGGFLTSGQMETLVKAGFGWLLSDEKVAVKAHAIRLLYQAGKSLPEVYPMLVPLIQKDFPAQSPGYRAAVREVLSRMRECGIDLP